MTQANPPSGKPGWLTAFLKELVSMPRRHMIVFFITAVLLVLLEVELTEGWHVVHILEILGALVFLYLLWTAWRTGRTGETTDSPSPSK
jgi:threonine/homoserine/homoserine lactone efflux protein